MFELITNYNHLEIENICFITLSDLNFKISYVSHSNYICLYIKLEHLFYPSFSTLFYLPGLIETHTHILFCKIILQHIDTVNKILI